MDIPDSESHCADTAVGACPLGRTVLTEGVVNQAVTLATLGLRTTLTYIPSHTKHISPKLKISSSRPDTGIPHRYCGVSFRPLQPSKYRNKESHHHFAGGGSCLQFVKSTIFMKCNKMKRYKTRCPCIKLHGDNPHGSVWVHSKKQKSDKANESQKKTASSPFQSMAKNAATKR